MKAVVSLVAALAVPAFAEGEVYKYVDENGILNYTNVEPPKNVDYTTLKFPCYASDASCRKVRWEEVPLNTRAFASRYAQRLFTTRSMNR